LRATVPCSATQRTRASAPASIRAGLLPSSSEPWCRVVVTSI
jgi:hypothetical protein